MLSENIVLKTYTESKFSTVALNLVPAQILEIPFAPMENVVHVVSLILKAVKFLSVSIILQFGNVHLNEGEILPSDEYEARSGIKIQKDTYRNEDGASGMKMCIFTLWSSCIIVY